MKITDSTNLGLAILIIEAEDGQYQPIAVVSTISEAHEMASHDFANRIKKLQGNGDPLCPVNYRLWAQGTSAEYLVAADLGLPR